MDLLEKLEGLILSVKIGQLAEKELQSIMGNQGQPIPPELKPHLNSVIDQDIEAQAKFLKSHKPYRPDGFKSRSGPHISDRTSEFIYQRVMSYMLTRSADDNVYISDIYEALPGVVKTSICKACSFLIDRKLLTRTGHGFYKRVTRPSSRVENGKKV